jgi:urea transporter
MNPSASRMSRAVLLAYAQVVFSSRPATGALLLCATLVRPVTGLWGLAGVLLATGFVTAIRLEPEAVERGAWGCNALLVSLVLGATWAPTPALGVVQLLAIPLVIGAQLAIGQAFAWHLRLPALSLPFVLSSWQLASTGVLTRGLVLAPERAPTAFDAGLPDAIAWGLRAPGALFAVPDAAAGLIVLAAIALHSRIQLVLAVLGAGVAVLLDRQLFALPPGRVAAELGFDVLLTTMALGAVFWVPGRASLTIATIAGALTAVTGVASLGALGALGLTPGAWPFNLTTLAALYALGPHLGLLGLTAADPGVSPESNLRRTRDQRARPVTGDGLRLPFLGPWVCTQGHDGAWTHQGAWRHGLDFEATDADGQTAEGDGARLRDHHCFDLPIHAPAACTVVSAVDGLPDQAPGTQDTANPWGNHVVLALGPERFLLLAHLAQGSVRVRDHEVVPAGATVGRCGASGRAPSPHLHVQLQASPEAGAPTIPITVSDAVVEGEDGGRLVFGHVPAEGERLRNLTVDAEIAAALHLPHGSRSRWGVVVDGRPSEVELRSQVDVLGRHTLRGSDGGELVFDPTGWCWIVVSCDAAEGTLAHTIATAMPRVPYDGADGLRWLDTPPADAGRGWLDVAFDLVAWLLPPRERQSEYTQRREHGRLWIEGAARDGTTTLAALDARAGITELQVRRGRHSVRAARLDDAGSR